MNKCRLLNLGRIEYEKALAYQHLIFDKRKGNEVQDTLILAEHDPVYTCGRSENAESLIKSELPKGIELVKVDRGGSITFHGPGQLMLYPIISIKGRNIIHYLRSLEQSVISAMAIYGIKARGNEKSGVWVSEKKLASVGVKVSQSITMHGISLNVNCDLSYFEPIRACSTDDKQTSMQELVGYELEMEDVIDLMILNFGKVFNYRFSEKGESIYEPPRQQILS